MNSTRLSERRSNSTNGNRPRCRGLPRREHRRPNNHRRRNLEIHLDCKPNRKISKRHHRDPRLRFKYSLNLPTHPPGRQHLNQTKLHKSSGSLIQAHQAVELLFRHLQSRCVHLFQALDQRLVNLLQVHFHTPSRQAQQCAPCRLNPRNRHRECVQHRLLTKRRHPQSNPVHRNIRLLLHITEQGRLHLHQS